MQTLLEQPGGGALTREHFRQDVLAGLARPAKTLPCKYLYDERGAELFEAICGLEEYYPTRTETAILYRHIREIGALLGRGCHLVDLGSGSGTKTRLLLKHLDQPASLTPVDVAHAQLLESAERLAEEWPGLRIWPVCADYTNGFILPHLPSRSEHTTVFFPGSTIGNFEPEEAVHFLRRLIAVCGPRIGLLLGVDLRKEPARLHAAYNDASGITAAFNLNLLARINRELNANFNLAQFRHHARFNDQAGRIEMHLVSRKAQCVRVGEHTFTFTAGESVVTEHSYKYRPGEFNRLAAAAGFQLVRCWTDENEWFSVNFFKATASQPRRSSAPGVRSLAGFRLRNGRRHGSWGRLEGRSVKRAKTRSLVNAPFTIRARSSRASLRLGSFRRGAPRRRARRPR